MNEEIQPNIEVKTKVDYKLPPEKQKILGDIIESVLVEYDKESKFYTAEVLHFLGTKITSLAKKELGDDIVSVQVILDLRHVIDIRFGFKVDVPIPTEEPKEEVK